MTCAENFAGSREEQELVQVQRLHLFRNELAHGEPSSGIEVAVPAFQIDEGSIDVGVVLALGLEQVANLRCLPRDLSQDAQFGGMELLLEALLFHAPPGVPRAVPDRHGREQREQPKINQEAKRQAHGITLPR